MTGDAGPALGLYVHWPFCARICPYCDFNVVRDRGDGARAARLTEAIVRDIQAHAAWTGARRLTSVFFGGGTPSRMAPGAVAAILAAARGVWTADSDLEVSLEANPADCDEATLAALAEVGVGRLSLGVQSFDDARLIRLGRDHDAGQARDAAARARSLFPRLSLDLIWGLPDDSAATWRRELDEAIALGPEHISTYELTFEPGTAFDRARRRGSLSPLDEAARADLHELADALLGAAGYAAYEVSNHARGTAARARHNLLYWQGGDWAGVGPGAHGRLTRSGARWASEAPASIEAYVAAVSTGGIGAAFERLEPRQHALERLLMGLRIAEGAPLAELAPLAIPASRLAELAPLATVREGRLQASQAGRNVLDALVRRLVA